ncbi:MAG: C40 family peptidase [Gemmatimonadales bacterium]
MDKLERAVDDIRRKWVPDPRLGVFEVAIAPSVGAQHAAPLLTGATSSRDAQDALRRLAREQSLAEEVRLLPDAPAGQDAAVVTAALAPLHGTPQLATARVSEALHGETLAILEHQGDWLRVRAPDDYVAWVHSGYVATGPAGWAIDWEQRATARSLGADVQTPAGRRRLPTGARVVLRRNGSVELADGQRGKIAGGGGGGGAVRPEAELRVEARHLALPELAQKWYAGAPYLWGGRTEWGIDCSGLAQAIYGARGIRLPRDSDQQFGQGREVPMAPQGVGYEAGDLLFFAERGRVSHVAFWAGAGRIVHAALSRGGVGGDHLFGDEPRMKRLRENLVGVRRM